MKQKSLQFSILHPTYNSLSSAGKIDLQSKKNISGLRSPTFCYSCFENADHYVTMNAFSACVSIKGRVRASIACNSFIRLVRSLKTLLIKSYSFSRV